MRIGLLFILAFVCGIYGFNFFAPYLLCVVMLENVLRHRRQAMLRPAPIPVARRRLAVLAASI